MGLREDLAVSIDTLIGWLLQPPVDPELWPDERLKLLGIVDHLEGVDNRPPERAPHYGDYVTVKTSHTKFARNIPRRWTSSSSRRVRTKATGRQLVRYARYLVLLTESIPLRNAKVDLPPDVLELLEGLRYNSDAAESIVSLRGEVL